MDEHKTGTVPSDAELRARLTPLQYQVTRQKGTERAHTRRVRPSQGSGRLPLRLLRRGPVQFRQPSTTAVQGGRVSGCRWPATTCAPTPTDRTAWCAPKSPAPGATRTWATCSRTVPQPSGQRYCINSASLAVPARSGQGQVNAGRPGPAAESLSIAGPVGRLEALVETARIGQRAAVAGRRDLSSASALWRHAAEQGGAHAGPDPARRGRRDAAIQLSRRRHQRGHARRRSAERSRTRWRPWPGRACAGPACRWCWPDFHSAARSRSRRPSRPRPAWLITVAPAVDRVPLDRLGAAAL